MQTKLSTLKYDCIETIKHENIECPIDIEYSLPDYCPNIQKILKCIPYVNLSSYSFTQDRLMCEGKLVLQVQYLDENTGSIRVCEIQKEFSHVGQILQSEFKTYGKIKTSTGHIICRAINARKLDIHVPIILQTTLMAQKENEINCDAENLEKKTESITVSNAIACSNTVFAIEQELKLSDSLPPIDCILRNSIDLTIMNKNVENGRVSVDATADITIFYRSFSQESLAEKMQYSIPFNQSFEISGVEQGDKVSLDLDVCEFSIQAKEDVDGEYTSCDMYAKISANIMAYKDDEIDLIIDAYSSEKNCDFKYENMSFNYLSEQNQEEIKIVKSLFLSDDELEKLIDYWCEDVFVTPYCEKNKINYRGKFNICMTYKGKSEQIFCVTKSFDFTSTKDFSTISQRKCDALLKVNIKDFRIIDGNNVEFTCMASLKTTEFECYNKNTLAKVEHKENTNNIQKDCIKVYYAKKEESLWDIGKMYHCPVSEIVVNNKLSDSEFSNGEPLLIF